MKNRILFNISNHPSLNWSAEQREGWNEIVDIPFPNVSPTADMDEVRGLAISIARKVKEICREKGIERPCVMVQGEFSLCAFIYQTYTEWVFFFPTTERVVEEIPRADGTIEKKTTFKFIRWRDRKSVV